MWIRDLIFNAEKSSFVLIAREPRQLAFFALFSPNGISQRLGWKSRILKATPSSKKMIMRL
jgi:hypothetical protein